MPAPTPYDNPPPTSPTECSGRPRSSLGDRIFCDNVTIDKKTTAKDDIVAEKNITANVNIIAKNEIEAGKGLVLKKPMPKIVVRETTETGEVVSEVEYLEAIIETPGPLSATIVSFPDTGLTSPIIAGMRLLIALPPA